MNAIPPTFKRSPPYLIAFAGAGAGVLYAYQGVLWTLFVALLYGVLAWFIMRRKLVLVRTPLDWILAAAAAVMLLSWLLSPSLRLGMDRLFLFLFFLWFFYFLLAVFQAGFNRRAVLLGLLSFSAIVPAFAALEVYVHYYYWFQSVGSLSVLPPYPYRLYSMLAHPNPYMVYVNLIAPLVVTGLFLSKSVLLRTGAFLWLACYFLTLPFSSSRGGWLGFVVWSAVLAGKWLYDNRVHQRLWLFFKKKMLLTLAGSAFAAFAAAWTGYRFWAYFTYHPTHTPNLLGSRSHIWLYALDIFKTSPLFGAGIGRFEIEYMAAASIPPGFLAPHAHNSFFQALAETGLAGTIVLLALTGLGLAWMWRRYRDVLPEWRPWSWAVIAAVLGFLTTSMTEDCSGVLMIMVPFITLAAFQLTAARTPLPRRSTAFTALAWLPGILFIAWGGWSLWAAQPAAAAGEIAQTSPRPAAYLYAEGARRDPYSAAAHAQAGLAWAVDWDRSRDPQSLANARAAYQRSLHFEPLLSYHWANLAVLDWHAADPPEAAAHIQEALALAPREPSYHLLAGWFEEQMGDAVAAQQSYHQVLALAPAWSSHPFWQANLVRSAALPETVQVIQEVSSRPPDLYQSAAAHWTGNLLSAQLLKIQAAELTGDEAAAVQGYAALEELAARSLVEYGFQKPYHTSVRFDLVPGYLILAEDQGQFAALERLHDRHNQSGACPQAARTWALLHRLRAGGSLETPPPVPACDPQGQQP
jgi:O-antigen ligase/tetratricopeptide (TPR) repeat protein